MNKYERFAIDHHLRDINDDLSFDEIIAALNNGALPLCCIYYPYDNVEFYSSSETKKHVAEYIIKMVKDLQKTFN